MTTLCLWELALLGLPLGCSAFRRWIGGWERWEGR
jgi:hypothetical protein